MLWTAPGELSLQSPPSWFQMNGLEDVHLNKYLIADLAPGNSYAQEAGSLEAGKHVQ